MKRFMRDLNIRKAVTPQNIAIAVMILAILILALFAFNQYQENQRLKTIAGQEELTQQQIDSIKQAVSEHILLPDEEPIIATIEDIESLKAEQPFYEMAENGDHILVFAESRKAMIYSPSRDIIVNVGSLDVADAGGE